MGMQDLRSARACIRVITDLGKTAKRGTVHGRERYHKPRTEIATAPIGCPGNH